MTALPKIFTNLASPAGLRQVWGLLKSVPGGKLMMSRLMGRMAPYTGTINAEILELAPGHCKMQIRDRRRVRNHLNSVHAIALMNLGEATTGVAMMLSLPDGTKGIPIRIAMDYLKKSRGTISCECDCELVTSTERKEYDVAGTLRDSSGEVVAKVQARWMVGPT